MLKILDGLLDDLAIDPANLIGIADDQAVVADRVDKARDPSGVFGDPHDRRIREKPEVRGAGDPEPRADVLAGLCRCQREDPAAEANALLELAQLGPI